MGNKFDNKFEDDSSFDDEEEVEDLDFDEEQGW